MSIKRLTKKEFVEYIVKRFSYSHVSVWKSSIEEVWVNAGRLGTHKDMDKVEREGDGFVQKVV